MQRLEVSGAVRLIYRSLGVKGLKGLCRRQTSNFSTKHNRISTQKSTGIPKLLEEKKNILYALTILFY